MKRASDNLVKAAQKAAFDKAEDDSVVVKTKFVGGIAQVRPIHNPKMLKKPAGYCLSWLLLHYYPLLDIQHHLLIIY